MKYIRWRQLAGALILPGTFIVVTLSLGIIWWLFHLPQGDELVAAGRVFFDTYGYAALFISAVIEGALVLGFYYPGGFVVVLSVVLAGKDPLKVSTIVAIVSVAFTIGLSADYLLGRYGWYHLLLKLGFRQEMEKAERRLQKHGLIAIFLTYWDINIASFTGTAAGILRYPYKTFLPISLLAFLVWNSWWALVVYFIGASMLKLASGNINYALAAIGIWAFVIIAKHILGNMRAARLSIP